MAACWIRRGRCCATVRPGYAWRFLALAVQSRWMMRLGAVFMRVFGPVRRMNRLLGLIPDQVSISRLAEYYPATAAVEKRGSVELFTGCLGEALEQDTLKATISVLNRLGFDVRVPGNQGCCGAIHQHAGYPQKAAELAENNLQAFAGDDIVIAVSTGCLASLCEYEDFFQDDEQRKNARQFAARCTDINEFLVEQMKGSQATLAPSSATGTVALHTPCTRKVLPGNTQAAYELLATHTSVNCLTLGNGQCCGAAGAYLLDQPEASQALAERYAIDIAPVLLTSNIGCRLQLEALCRRKGIAAMVAHPVSLLAASDSFSQTTTATGVK